MKLRLGRAPAEWFQQTSLPFPQLRHREPLPVRNPCVDLAREHGLNDASRSATAICPSVHLDPFDGPFDNPPAREG